MIKDCWKAMDKDGSVFTFSDRPYISHPESVAFWWHPTASIEFVGKGRRSLDWTKTLERIR